MNKMHEIFVSCAFHPLYLPFVYICPPDLPSSRCFPVRGKRLPGKLTSLLSPPTRADRIYIACRFQVIVFVCVLRERDRARVELCLYFWPSKFFGIGALAMASDDDVDDVKIPVSLLLNRLEYFSVACGGVDMSRRESKYI